MNPKTFIKFVTYLKEICPKPKCLLTYKKDYEFLIKVMLSAQSKDTEVNKYADILFDKFKTLNDLSNADLSDIRDIIKPLGFSQNKSINIKCISTDLLQKYKGKVPNRKDDLLKLKGVGNKTANCILNELYDEKYIAVDTHVQRVCKRLRFVSQKCTPIEIEDWLNKYLPDEEKLLFSNRTIYFGRNICTAKKPNCSICKMKSFCNVYGFLK